MGQHRPGFPRVLWDALIRLDYDGDIPLYHCHPIKAHGLDMCEVRVLIPLVPRHHGREPSSVASLMTLSRRWHMQLSHRCVRVTLPLPPTCQFRTSRSTIRRTPCGSSVSRPSSAVAHFHCWTRTGSYRSHNTTPVRPSMGGTTPASSYTSPVRRWTPASMRSYTSSMSWSSRTLSSKRGQRRSPLSSSSFRCFSFSFSFSHHLQLRPMLSLTPCRMSTRIRLWMS
jgi:hypothetical protein